MDYGAKVSQKGYDVKTCADYLLVYSSAFRNLKIVASGTGSTTIPASGSGTTNTITFTHSLGYLSPFIVVYNGSTTLGVGKSYFMSDSAFQLPLESDTTTTKVLVDEFFDQGFSNPGDTVYFTWYQFMETFDTYSSSTINSGTTSGATSSDYGFRISKTGFDVKTCANIDCVVSSSFFTSIIHKKGTDTTGTVTHDLGYIPLFLGYINVSGKLYLANDLIASDTSNIYCTLNPGEAFYYVILKQKTI
jgi:hypothetical protein